MGLIVDPPNSPGHGRLWSHLASDRSFEELHAFARRLGIPERGFDRDHYDVPQEWYDAVVDAGATPVSSRELVGILVASGLRRPKAATLAPRRPGRLLLRPQRLREGDLVAVVSPAGPAAEGSVVAGVDLLRSWGLRVREVRESGEATRARDEPGGGSPLPWLAGDDRARADAFAEAWTDPEVRAVWAVRGGVGTHRILDLLDWDRLAGSTPRLLVGLSDVTALHQAVAARLGLATLHGPGIAALGVAARHVAAAVRRQVMDAGPTVLHAEPGGAGPGQGPVEGVLVGGNLTVLAAGVGTEHVRTAAGGIAILEDVGERPYRLDRSLTQLLRSGWLAGARAVALGSFTDCGDAAQVRALLDERLGALGVPLLHGVPVGHAAGDVPVPLGVRATLDAAAGSLTVGPGLR